MSGNKTRKPEKAKRKTPRLNILILICGIILIYLTVHFCTYFFNNTTALYEVVDGSTQGRFNKQYTALALRSETVVNSTDTGYINFFIGDSIPIAVGDQTYVIDESGELSQRLEEASRNQTVLNENDLKQIKDTIFDFDISYNPQNYYDAYYFKYKIQSQVLDLINNNVFANLNSSVSNASAGTYSIAHSDIAGIMQHSVDGFENYTVDDIEAAMFRRANYNKQIIRSNDLVQSGDPVFKVVTDDDWKLVFQLDGTDDFTDVNYVTIDFLSDGIRCDGDFETVTHAGAKYGIISLSKYMIRYISDRYIQIQIVSDKETGLKIPKSSVGVEQFYIIPVEFITQGGNSTGSGFLKQTTDSNGNVSAEYVECKIAKMTDEYCYVSTDTFNSSDILLQPETSVQYKITAKENLEGVYLSAAGTYAFKIIDILGEDNGYYIINSLTSDGVRVYDQILKNASEKSK